MPLREMRRSLAVLLAAGLALSLASALAACSGAPEERPAPVATAAPIGTPSPTPVATAAPTGTPSPTPAAPPSPTPVATVAPTEAPSPTAAPTPTATPTPTDEATPVETPSSTTIRYDRYDTTGEVTEPGSYAFLEDPANTTSAVTTYEALRDGTTTALLIHKSDAHGASQAALYDAVEAGDLFEWHEADDCFVRYKVTEVKPDPAGAVPRKLLAVEWMTYAYTGCSGAVPASSVATVDLVPENLQSPAITVPIRHGPWQLVPDDWTGARENTVLVPTQRTEETYDVAAVRRHRLWREPALPDGWRLGSASAGFEGIDGVIATYFDAEGYIALVLQIQQLDMLGSRWSATTADPRTVIVETRIIDGHPAYVKYSPIDDRIHSTLVRIYNRATGVEYLVIGSDPSISGGNVDAAIEIARSLLPPPTAFRYDTYDTTGEVAEPGSYAFLEDPADTASAVTTYEALRDGTTTALLIHKSDAYGASQAALYDAVEAGDLFEWHEADDCFVRYTVTEVRPDPAGAVPRKLLAVEWMTYAYTGCSGAVSANAAATVDWGELPDLGGTALTFPVRHGPYQLVPEAWTGSIEPQAFRAPPAWSDPENPTIASDLPAARRLPYWRDPVLPSDWTFIGATDAHQIFGYCADWANDQGYGGVEICGKHSAATAWSAERRGPYVIYETRVFDGRPTLVRYSPTWLPEHSPAASIKLWIYDEATDSEYTVRGLDGSLRGSSIDAVIAIARSLFEPPNPLPPPTAFRYDTYDTTGEVATPGSYAFLEDPADTASAVTTYEALRDGTTTALLIHKSDAYGASQAALYDAVEAGDLFEWHEADDCFVRYTVTEVKPNPGGPVHRKLLAVEWMTYAFMGCRAGAVSASAAATVDWGELPDIGGTSLAVPVRHGPFQIIPEGWGGVRSFEEYDEPPDLPANSPGSDGYFHTTDLATAKRHAYWRDPTLPEGWTFMEASSGGLGDPLHGYCARWNNERGYPGVEICGYYITGTVGGFPASSTWPLEGDPIGQNVHETRVISGRPAVVDYSPRGPLFNDFAEVEVHVYDAATGIAYLIWGLGPPLLGDSVDAGIAIARSLLEDPNPLPPPTTFRYDSYDTTGEVAEPGSYAFLLAEGGSTTAAATWVDVVNHRATTQLRVHLMDAEGTSQAPFYEQVAVGDVFDWWMSRRCYFRFRVTELLPDVPDADMRKTFAIEHVTGDIFECSTERQGPAEFRWNPPEAVRGPDGVLQMITGVPVSGGRTYRLAPWSPVTIDVPEGMRLVRYTTLVLNPDGTWTVGLRDVASGSYLKLDMLDGTEHGRHIEAREGDARDVSALFDRIVESVHVDY